MVLEKIPKKKKTELVTLRLKKETLENLRKESRSRDISLNTLMGHVINQHLKWYSQAPQLGIIPMIDTQFKLILKDFSKSKLLEIVQKGREKYGDGFMLSINSKDTSESLVECLDTYGKIAGLNYIKDETEKSVTLIFNHNCGKNFSIFSVR